MSVLPCLTVRRIIVPGSRSSQFLCICQVLSKSSGQIYSSHIGSKNVSCFCQIMSLCCWDTYKMCAKICGSWTDNFRVSVTQNRLVHGTDSWLLLLKKQEHSIGIKIIKEVGYIFHYGAPGAKSWLNNICGAFRQEAFLLLPSIFGGCSNNSCSTVRSLFSAAWSCNQCFYCFYCKTILLSFV